MQGLQKNADRILNTHLKGKYDKRFPKESTRWKFILVVKDIKPELEPILKQANRSYGQIFWQMEIVTYIY